MTAHRKRSPKGVDHARPIALRLMFAEREQAEVISKRLGKTKSALAREAYLAGLPLVASSPSVAEASPAADSSGTASSPSRATLFTPTRSA